MVLSVLPDVMDMERENGRCPLCGAPAALLTCCECGESGWVIDCRHLPQPRPLARGRSDGSDGQRLFCDDCSEMPAIRPRALTRRAQALMIPSR